MQKYGKFMAMRLYSKSREITESLARYPLASYKQRPCLFA